MKRMISVVITLGLIFVLYQFFVLLVMNHHASEYSIKTLDNSYMIEEKLDKKGKFNMYSLSITDKEKNTFVASYDKNLNKQSRIIKDVKLYKKNNLYCIAPVLKNKEIENISCKLNNDLVSVTYLHQIGNVDIDEFIMNLKDTGYQLNEKIDAESTIQKTESNISLYNILEEETYLAVWGYRGIYAIGKNEIEFRDMLEKDEYFNNYGILVDRYYIVLKTDDANCNTFAITNIKDGGKATIETEYIFSKNSYFNGIYKGKAYFTDIDNKKQYIINPKSEKATENKVPKFYDGEKLTDANISELISDKKYFANHKISEEIEKNYPNIQLKESHGNYYYMDSGNIYQVVGAFSKHKILLFHFDDFKEMKIINNKVYGISNDTLYVYSNGIGLRKVLTNREFSYNSYNSYDIYES